MIGDDYTVCGLDVYGVQVDVKVFVILIIISY